MDLGFAKRFMCLGFDILQLDRRSSFKNEMDLECVVGFEVDSKFGAQ